MNEIEYDLEKISNNFTEILEEFQKLEYEYNLNFINHKLFNFRTSYLAPAYHLNRFDKATNEFFKIDLPNSIKKGVIDENDMSLLAIKLHLEFNSVIYSIKMSLDRIVFFMSKFYKGITPHNTFGRINENGKPKSMMAEVVRLKDSDKIMALILKNYNEWISDAVKPRDTITHYENLTLSFLEMDNSEFTPVFSHREKGINSFGREELKKYIDNWYLFINRLLELILSEKIKTTGNNVYKK
ncbi:hypothetical protein [Aquimarina longa]|uniref:hypothetical protein n=1 Tax=Aquimarina longa TaxID=1080221 RepID=UPI000783C767|nr:hypothetical protein [Aquimarina longa]